MKFIPTILQAARLVSYAFIVIGSVEAQTTLSGDHVITGNLNVGTSGTRGNLVVTGSLGDTASPGLSITGDGGVVFIGTSGTGQIPATGDGVRFMWYPKKAAIRAGFAQDGSWDDANIGQNSSAFGQGTSAIGESSSAFGYYTVGAGDGSYAMGTGSVAGGGSSTAMGCNTYSGDIASTTMGYGTQANSMASTAMGYFTMAYGTASTVSGISTSASGEASTAMGENSDAGGTASVATGASSAWGSYSTAMGYQTVAESYSEVVIGRYNVFSGTENGGDWVDSDRLFVIGNGSGNSSDPAEVQNRDAFAVYKNGDVKIPKRQGDIPMGQFGNPE